LALKRNLDFNYGVPPPSQATVLSGCTLYLSVSLRGCRFHPSRKSSNKLPMVKLLETVKCMSRLRLVIMVLNL